MLNCWPQRSSKASSPVDYASRPGGKCPDARVGRPSGKLRHTLEPHIEEEWSRRRRVEHEVERRHRRLVLPRKQVLSNDIRHMLQRSRGASRWLEGDRERAPAGGKDANCCRVQLAARIELIVLQDILSAFFQWWFLASKCGADTAPK